MSIDDELGRFDTDCGLLEEFINELARLETDQVEQKHIFLSESVLFRLFRAYERLSRAVFLNACVETRTNCGNEVISKLRCADWNTAEDILKSGNRFLDWGNIQNVRNAANLIFERGFPVVDYLGPVASTLNDLLRLRNYIAHDSSEARNGFLRAASQYVKTGDEIPTTVGELALYRRRVRADITLRIIFDKTSSLSDIYRQL